jgi:predicted unusual protein kinase regulating ubiquinone biosynthesis (AarF/ABC1/UbiB family)
VPPFPGEEALAIVEDDLGTAAADAFAAFDPVPLSAASIAQVHGCLLRDGRPAVLKIQRPDIADRMNRDLRMMYRLAAWSTAPAPATCSTHPGLSRTCTRSPTRS